MEREIASEIQQRLNLAIVDSYDKNKNQVLLKIQPKIISQILKQLVN
jgi:hypothetical protein